LIAVVAIIGLTAGLVAISIARFQEKSGFRAEVGRVAGILRSARAKAIMDRTRCIFEITGDDDGEQPRFLYGYSCDDTPGASRPLPYGYTLRGPRLAFFPKGFSTGGLLELNDSGGRRARIRIDHVTGKIVVGR